ncbi:MAG: hypothetical protein JNN04_14395 [Cyclobacteriaceae bacterium]|nr:hypothetical protein [Cyclobacteriaceae bacterium]
MEKDLVQPAIDIVIKAQESGEVLFQIKDPKNLNRALLNGIKQDFFLIDKGAVVVYPEQKIIDSQRVFIEDTTRVI